MTRDRSTEEPCAAKVARTVLKTSGGSDPLAEFNPGPPLCRALAEDDAGDLQCEGGSLGGTHLVGPGDLPPAGHSYVPRLG